MFLVDTTGKIMWCNYLSDTYWNISSNCILKFIKTIQTDPPAQSETTLLNYRFIFFVIRAESSSLSDPKSLRRKLTLLASTKPYVA